MSATMLPTPWAWDLAFLGAGAVLIAIGLIANRRD
jgi:hypothetical protein